MKVLMLAMWTNRDMMESTREELRKELFDDVKYTKILEHGCLIGPWNHYVILETEDDGPISNVRKRLWKYGEVLSMVINSCDDCLAREK